MRWRSNDALRASFLVQQVTWPEVDLGRFLVRLLPGRLRDENGWPGHHFRRLGGEKGSPLT
ncbi:hypothetical protein [Thermogemmatispora sp.]|uniref:hypothetical protein n=1 Tax=Thermogemmatispora sp. TaxID=1968838 RepID=UPI001DF5D262|nr:hypothetical protein [Thermogemmatispora sp.]MBX5451759.1 hypothetical protein [Thermogemmatispora sp.]